MDKPDIDQNAKPDRSFVDENPYREEYYRGPRDEGYPHQEPYPSKSQAVNLELMFRPQMIAKLVIAGMVLFFIGAIITTAAISTDPEEKFDDRYEDGKGMYKAGLIVAEIGIMFTATALLVGGILCKEIDQPIRKGMLAAAVTMWVGTLVLILFGPLMSLSLLG